MFFVFYIIVSHLRQEPITIEPAWYAEHIWKGEKPEFLSKGPNQNNSDALVSPKVEQDQLLLDNVSGRIILNQLASGTGKAVSKMVLIINMYHVETTRRSHQCRIGYSDFHNLMGFTSKKMPNNIL